MGERTRYTLKEVAQNDGKEGNDTWIIVHNLVYDVTSYKAGVRRRRISNRVSRVLRNSVLVSFIILKRLRRGRDGPCSNEPGIDFSIPVVQN